MKLTRYAPAVGRVTKLGESGLISTEYETVAELIHCLGDIQSERVLIKPMPGTEEDVIRFLHCTNKRIFELIDGVLVEKAMGTREGFLASFISRRIGDFAEANDLGLTGGGDAPFRLKLGLVRIPDVSFVSWDRIPGDEFPEDAIAGIIPDLAIEVLSESNTLAEINLKLDHYFKAGVRLAWIIDPRKKSAEYYTSRNRSQRVESDGELSGGKVLPGFRITLREIFGSLRRKKRKPRSP